MAFRNDSSLIQCYIHWSFFSSSYEDSIARISLEIIYEKSVFEGIDYYEVRIK